METDPKRKMFRTVWLAFFVILSVALAAYLWPSVEDRSFIYALKGEVTIRIGRGDNAMWEQAKINDPMNPGNRLKTTTNSTAEVRLNDGSLLRIGPNTELEVLSVFINPMMGVRNAQWRVISAGTGGGVYVNTGKTGSIYEIQSSQFIAVVSSGSMRVFSDENGNDVIKVIDPDSKAVALIGNEKHSIPPGSQALIKDSSTQIVQAKMDEVDAENEKLDKPNLILNYQSPTVNKSITITGVTGLKTSVFVDGERVTDSDEMGNFRFELSIPVGKIEHVVTVTDTAGRRNEQTILLERISQGEHLLAITEPKSGITVTDEEIDIKGTIQGSKKLTINGNPVEIFRGSFDYKVKLKMGLNTFTVLSTDDKDRARQQTIWVTRDVDKIEASLDIYYPTTIITTKEKSITIKGVTSAKRIRIGESLTTLKSSDFSIETLLELGRNAIIVSAEDENHKTNSKTIVVIREVEDAARPDIKLDPYPAFTNNITVIVGGIAFNTESLTIDGNKILVEANGVFRTSLKVTKDGKNTFNVVAISKDDVKSTITINIWRDTVAPDLGRIKARKVKSENPDDENKILVVGVIEQNCDLYVNGIKVELIGTGDLRNVSYILKDYTEKMVSLKAIDKAGNQSVKEIDVANP